MAQRDSRFIVYVALAANAAIAVAKFIAAAASGSASMFAEGIHSTVDCGNEVLLLVGLKRSKKPPDEEHPFGHGKELYFWSLIMANALFGLGGGVSIYEGIDHLIRPRMPENARASYVVLAIAAVFEGTSLVLAAREMRRRRPGKSLWAAVRASKDPSVFSVIFEDSGALVGIVLAFFGVFLSTNLDAPWIDGVASILIGLTLATMAVLLGRETRGLLVGESADPAQLKVVREIASSDPDVQEVVRTMTMQLGPDAVLLALDVRFRHGLTSIAEAIDRLEQRIREKCPTIRHIFVEAEAVAKRR